MRRHLAGSQQAGAEPEKIDAVPMPGEIVCYDEATFTVSDRDRLGGSALISGVFERADGTLWVGKCNHLESEQAAQADAVKEIIASNIYEFYGVNVPKTACARLPIKLPEWAHTQRELGEVLSRTRTHTVYMLSEIIAGYYNLGSIPALTARGNATVALAEHGELEVVDLGRLLAVATFIFDVDVLGGSGGNAGFVVKDGKAVCVKIDPGEAFSAQEAFRVGEREIRVATQALNGVLQFSNFPAQVKREFLETLALIIQTTDAMITEFFMRKGAGSLLLHKDAQMLREMPRLMIERRETLKRIYARELRTAVAKRAVKILQPRAIEEQDIMVNLATMRSQSNVRLPKQQVQQSAGGGGGGGAAAEPALLTLTRRTVLVKTQPVEAVVNSFAALFNRLERHDADDLSSSLQSIWDKVEGDEPIKQDQFREANGFGVLIPFLQHPNKEVQFPALGLIYRVTKKNKTNQAAFLAADGLLTISKALEFNSARVQMNAMQILLNYTYCQEANQAIFATAGMLPKVINLLNSGHSFVRSLAMTILIDFAIKNDQTMHTENLATIWQSLHPEMLAGLLKDNDATIRKHAMMLVCFYIRSDKVQKDSFKGAGGVPEVIRLLSDRDPKITCRAIDAIRYLARIGAGSAANKPNQDMIREEGGIVALLALLKHEDSEVRRKAAVTLYYVLDNNPDNQAMLHAAGGIKKVLDLLKDPDAGVKQQAVTALHYVTKGHVANLTASHKAGALELLKQVHRSQLGKPAEHTARVIAAFEMGVQRLQAAAQGGGGAKKAAGQPQHQAMGQMINYTDLTYGRKVGEGAFGSVFLGKWKGQNVAIKELKAQGAPQSALQEMLQEGLVMMQLRHPNVMHVHGICTQPGHYGLIMQFISGGSLEDLLKKQTTDLSWQRRVTIAIRMSRGMDYLHKHKILHRDLKSPNILMESGDHPRITDFGLVKVKNATQTMVAQKDEGAGTLLFMAPELFQPKATFRSASDVYSFAMVLYELAARKMPWIGTPGLTQQLLMMAVCSGKRPAVPQGTPPGFSEIMKRCWAQRIDDRPNFEKIEEELTTFRASM